MRWRALAVMAVLSGCGDDRLRGVQRDDAGQVICGSGTVYDAVTMECVAQLTCGPGTVRQGNACVAVMTDGGLDAGTRDAGIDAGAPDAGAPDAGATDAGSSCADANTLVFDGSGYVFTGHQLVTAGTFTSAGTNLSVVSVHVVPSSTTQGLWWDLDFAAPADAGALTVGSYPVASRYPFQPPTIAGLSVSGDGRGCNLSSGHFEVLTLARDDAGLVTDFQATFEQLCENQPSNVLRGCVRFVR